MPVLASNIDPKYTELMISEIRQNNSATPAR